MFESITRKFQFKFKDIISAANILADLPLMQNEQSCDFTVTTQIYL